MKFFHELGEIVLKYLAVILIAIFVSYLMIGCEEDITKTRLQDLQSQYTDLSNKYLKLQKKDEELQLEIDKQNDRLLVLENSHRSTNEQQ